MEVLLKLFISLFSPARMLMAVIQWGKKSRLHRIVVALGTFDLIACFVVLCLAFIVNANGHALQKRSLEYQYQVQIGKLKEAASALAICNQSINLLSGKTTQSCDVAISRYEEAFRGFGNPIIAKNVRSADFAAMHSHVTQELHMEESIRILRTPDTFAMWLQRHIVTLDGLTAISLATMLVIVALLFAMRATKPAPAKVAPRRLVIKYRERISSRQPMRIDRTVRQN